MILSSQRLDEFEARYEHQTLGALSYEEALQLFAALWAEARALRPDLGLDWREDLDADLAVARAVNGLPPGA